MRKKQTKETKEFDVMECTFCKLTFTATFCLEQAIENGYKRLGIEKPSETKIIQMRSEGLRPEPEEENEMEHDHWLLDLATIQLKVNLHDWKHRASCFKSARKSCRYNIL